MDTSSRARMERTLKGWKPSANVSEAFGKLFAALDIGQRLLRDYKTNLHRLKSSERPAWIVARAAEQGLDLREVFSAELAEAAKRVNIDIDATLAYFLNKYFDEYSATGNPPEFAPYFGQGSMVVDWPGPDGTSMPVAIAWLTPYGNKAKALENFQEAALALEDRQGAGVDPATVDDLAKILLMRSFGLSNSEIGWELLAQRLPEIRALDAVSRARDYAEPHRKEMDRLRQVRSRGWESVTRMVPSLSRFDD